MRADSTRPVSRPRSSNRTCGFPASGFPTGFIADSQTYAHRPLEPNHTQRAEHPFLGELVGAVRRHLVAASQKVPHYIMERIEELFQKAAKDHSLAPQLKSELDRWNLYELYENRFLDLFEDEKGSKE